MTESVFCKYNHQAAIVASLLLTGCSYEYKLLVTVTDGSGYPLSENVRVLAMTKAYDEGDLPAQLSDSVDSAGELEISVCCSPNPQVWVYAFIDANASSYWDNDEHLQAAENPLRLSDDTTVTIQFD